MKASQLVASPCSNPELGLDEALAAYSEMGYRKFEVFLDWAHSSFDLDEDPETYLAKGRRYGMAFTSLHLPTIEDDIDAGIAEAVRATRFAAALGAKAVLFKGQTRELIIKAAGAYLDAIEGLGVTPTVQNHAGTAIATLDDYREVLDGINDERMKTVLEVGMFCSVGVLWPEACELLDGRIGLAHLKDQIGEKRVPFGEGEVDFAGLFAHMDAQGYTGDYVVEMEAAPGNTQRTLELLRAAREHLLKFCTEK